MAVGIIHEESALGEYQGEKLENARLKWMFYDVVFNCMMMYSLHPNLCPYGFLLPCVGWSCLKDESVKASAFQRALWHLWRTEGAQGAEIVFG